MSCLFENKLQSLWRLRNERCYEELDTCNNHLIVAKNTILLKLMIHLINNIRCVARMEMKFRHKKGRGMGAAARPPVDPGQSPGWGLGGKAARYSYVLFKKKFQFPAKEIVLPSFSLANTKHWTKFPRLIRYKKGVI